MNKPNVLFIFSDQHAQKVAGCYGDDVVRTPNIDRLAQEGVRFDNAYCPSPICTPSRMSMLTARWPHRQECWTNDDMLRSDVPTWLHRAGEAGYRPALIGRMHSIGPDQLHGYAERGIGDHTPNFAGIARFPMGVLEGTNEPDSVSLTQSGAGMAIYQRKDQDVVDAAAAWLRDKGAARNAAGQQFCLTVGLMTPHAPYVVDREAFDHYHGQVPPPRLDVPQDEHDWHRWWRHDRGIGEVSDAVRDRARAAYWGLVQRTDEMIGQVLDALKEIGAMDDTLIVYASDHGDHVGERGLWWKHTFFEESVKVPLVMRLPGAIPAGESRDQVVNLVDLSQTMIEVMGAQPLPYADGKSFWAVACDREAPWENETFSEYCTDPVPSWTGGRAVQQRMIRSGSWKLSVYDGEPPLLFDLSTDPDERINRAEDPDCAEMFQRLSARLAHDGWRPETVAARMRERRAEKDILAAWAREVQPAQTHVWEYTADMNRLDN
ncbi:sulfatase-like hydrolase/transferase [Sinorhizobium medicae]|uniref:Sulfatase n=2 Tax=Sinorhizobium medicae TaxID=110321 RepID=A0A508WXV6_9HYPH|nr:sulfatase-like hydrolase/transferase [Sinorhizobium medicae]MBO1941148.1 sulfatase-like hydrolase/transferase [Sinorhizobium medicae]MDX0422975.1 sulfatase-like hydrolase/transferase [Sinorhizobium medicae]MDX0428559.1 sulfatase-like hydrolase/transferase [Sinorhizobium medicae]MDX0440525.1 sulfatase-like hydrolase/transferase [Sinorhizobium medicae]MDX0460184.1 sulfatase-like hydrolase/transferase [Sinorhizobium medicae]